MSIADSGIRKLWTSEQLKLAFHLYCQLPFGRLHSRTPEVVALANLIGRTPSAVAMKLVNFASLDPDITGSGRRGLSNASVADRAVWDEFHMDWEGLDSQCLDMLARLNATRSFAPEINSFAEPQVEYVGEVRTASVDVRLKQDFFRRSVLASYESRCCMSGLSADELIVASHIVPWAEDVKNRLNPHNGLCLSSIHDRAFDRGLITVTPNMVVRVSRKVAKLATGSKLGALLAALEGHKITMPRKFWPAPEFLRWHNENLFKE